MYDNKINFRLVNLALLTIIVFLIYSIRGLWLGFVGKIFEIIAPFLLGFAFAYALYPLRKKLEAKGFPKLLAIFTVCFATIGTLILLVILVVPMLYDQILLFLSNLSVFIADFSSKYDLNLGVLQKSISEISSNVISNLGSSISDGAVNIVSTGISMVTNLIVIICVGIYLIFDMDRIREYVKDNLKRHKRAYLYIKRLDMEITNYFTGIGMNMIIQCIEYTVVFFLIGHPNFLILGLLAGVTNIIPYFGAFIINVLAVLIASVVSTKLFILTIVVCLVCPNIDGYIIGPKVYGKTNQLHPLINIFAVFAGGILGGFWGILLSLPIAIVLIATYKFFQDDINGKIVNLKEKKERA